MFISSNEVKTKHQWKYIVLYCYEQLKNFSACCQSLYAIFICKPEKLHIKNSLILTHCRDEPQQPPDQTEMLLGSHPDKKAKQTRVKSWQGTSLRVWRQHTAICVYKIISNWRMLSSADELQYHVPDNRHLYKTDTLCWSCLYQFWSHSTVTKHAIP